MVWIKTPELFWDFYQHSRVCAFSSTSCYLSGSDLQNGAECWCGNTYQRAYDDTAVCDMPCPGSPAEICGGASANSVYKVNRGSFQCICHNRLIYRLVQLAIFESLVPTMSDLSGIETAKIAGNCIQNQ